MKLRLILILVQGNLEFNGKYYHNLDAWRVFKATEVKESTELNKNDTEDDDLPF